MKQQLTIVLVLMIVGAPLMGAMTVSAQESEPYSTPNTSAPTDLSTITYSSGDGTESNPYVIMNDHQLQAMNNDPSAHYVLGKNIDASGTDSWNGGDGFTPIAESSFEPFSGSLNGNGYVIDGLYINRLDKTGLIGYSEGNVSNIGVVNADVTGGFDVGVLVGYNPGGTVSDSYATGTVSGDFNVGGLVGRNGDGTVSDSYASSLTVSGANSVGGLVGQNAGTVSDTYYINELPDGLPLIGRNDGDVTNVANTPSAVIKTNAMMIGSPIVFDASQSTIQPKNTEDVSYTWESNGETITSESSTIQVTHRSDGTQTLTLTVTTPDGSDTTSISYFVDDVPLDNFADEFDSESLESVLISEADEMGGDVTTRVTVDTGTDVYSGVLISDTQPNNGSWTVGESYTVGSNETVTVVYDETQSNGNMTTVNASTVELGAQDSYTISSAVDRTDGSTIDSVEWTDYTDDTTLMDDVSSYTSTSVPVDSGESDSDTTITPLGELTDTDKLILLGLGGGIFLVLVSRRMY